MERQSTILVSPVTALTELNAGGNIRPVFRDYSKNSSNFVPIRSCLNA